MKNKEPTSSNQISEEHLAKARRIKALRKAKGMTQGELATALGTTKQTIFKYEKPVVTNIPSDRVEQLAQVLGTTPGYILTGWIDATNKEKLDSDALADIAIKFEENKLFATTVQVIAELDEPQTQLVLDYAKSLL